MSVNETAGLGVLKPKPFSTLYVYYIQNSILYKFHALFSRKIL